MNRSIALPLLAVLLGLVALLLVCLHDSLAGAGAVTSSLLVGGVLAGAAVAALVVLAIIAGERRDFDDEAPTRPHVRIEYRADTGEAGMRLRTLQRALGRVGRAVLPAFVLVILLPFVVAGCELGDSSPDPTVDAGPEPIPGAGACCVLQLDILVQACFSTLADMHPVPDGWCRTLDCDDGSHFEVCQ